MKSLIGFCGLAACIPVLGWGQGAATDSGFRRIATIPIPANGTNPFDIGWVDSVAGRYYLGDRTSKSIDVVDTRTNMLVGQIGGFVGQSPKGPKSFGPSGVVAIPGTQIVWAGDGDSTVKVVDLQTRKIVDSISTGGAARADEIAYDDWDQVIIIGNDADQPVFLTWRLHGSLPPHRPFAGGRLPSGQAFAALDRLLDEARGGPFHLRQAALADMVVEAILHNERVLRQYVLHAFVVMPNHVHLLATAEAPLSKLTKSLKGITAKRGNEMLALTGKPFWQEESYDHVVRTEREFQNIRRYIEENPVRAGLVFQASEYRWSSAGWATGGSPADQGVRPTIDPHR